MPQVEIVGVTPVLGANVPLNQVPSNVQTVTARQLQDYHPWSLPEALNNNEPFGDVVYWDYVPLFAVERLQLIPGSNPVYGLNALGGAVTLQMKNGFDFQGLSTDLSAGSFDRQQGIVQYAIEKGDVAFYTGLMAANDGGWRHYSPSQIVRSYSDLELRKGPLDLGISFTFANNELSANGSTPEEMLESNRRPPSRSRTPRMIIWLSCKGAATTSSILRCRCRGHGISANPRNMS
jgi:hypothetical protein